jgi:hypothetical protein
VRASITHVDDKPRHDRGGIDELCGPLLHKRGLRAEDHHERGNEMSE